MMSKLINVLLGIAVAIIAVWLIVFIIGKIKDDNAVLGPTPIPTSSPAARVPAYTFNPYPPTNPTPIYSPTPEPGTTKGGLSAASGISGSVTLKECPSCIVKYLGNIDVPIKTPNGSLVATAKTNSSGQFSTILLPGQYVIGPVREPSSNAIAAATHVTVNPNYYSIAEISFSSSY